MGQKRRISLFIFILVMCFFYVPIFMFVVYSFNSSKGNQWESFSLRWYIELFTKSPDLWIAFGKSLLIAFLSSGIAVFISTLAAIGLKWFHLKGISPMASTIISAICIFCIKIFISVKISLFVMTIMFVLGAIFIKWFSSVITKYIKFINYIPLIIPDIIMGVSLLIFFTFKLQINKFGYNGIPLGMFTIFIAHTTFSIPFSLFIILARLDEFDYSIVEAARDLGANEWTALTKVIIPVMKPGIISAFLMSVTLSLDDFVITSFVTGVSSTTLPVQIYSMIKFGISPVINALSTILIVGTIILAITSKKFQKYML